MYGLKKYYYQNGTCICMQHCTYKLITSDEYKKRLQGYQNVATSYIRKQDVREYFLSKFNYRCVQCGSESGLQLHHKKWVARCAQERISIMEMNDEKNIIVLCKKCHMPRREEDDK